ncbi:hypothetical protein [Psychrobacter sp. NG27]|nr:hypothetical protein [Psychrobacter sp. NG27]
MPMIGIYKSMLSKWSNIGKPWNLSAQNINDILSI